MKSAGACRRQHGFRPALPSRHLRARLAAGLGRKAVELVTVFVGVYAAFLLNDHQAHREERQRREQILSWLEERLHGDARPRWAGTPNGCAGR